MSYLNHAQDPRRRATAMVTVGAVHALLAAGLLTGLAVHFERIVETRPIGVTVPLDRPKPEPDPVPTAKPVEPAYVPTDPPTAIQLPTDSTVIRDPVENNSTELAYFPTDRVEQPVRPALPQPSPSFTPKRATPSNSSTRWITNDDYPRRALVDEVEGSASYRLVIGTNGKVSSCELTSPTGNRALDEATCRLISNRARFDPATDESGAKVVGTYSGSVRWEIPN
jgi:protein TonB